MNLELKELTGKIVAASIEVHRKLGPGFLESIYQTALPIELNKDGLKVEEQILSYLKATKLKVGLLINFAKGTLKIKRVVN